MVGCNAVLHYYFVLFLLFDGEGLGRAEVGKTGWPGSGGTRL